MQLSYQDGIVVRNNEVEENIYKMEIKGSYEGAPGQFYMLKSWDLEPVLARPISINNIDENSITFLYQVKGKGTELLSRLRDGESIKLLGPLGNGFDTEKINGRVGIVSGGIGIAPLLYTAKRLNAKSIDLFAGFRDRDYMLDEFKEAVDNIYIATEDGSKGHKGYITDIFKPENYDIVLCCGPEIMMKKVARMCMEANTDVYVSLESHMACGMGACLVCTCKTKYGNKRVCKEGPVFKGEDVFEDA